MPLGFPCGVTHIGIYTVKSKADVELKTLRPKYIQVS